MAIVANLLSSQPLCFNLFGELRRISRSPHASS
ncbi:hypothetical protein, partial [Klebsiella pneumoniae]